MALGGAGVDRDGSRGGSRADPAQRSGQRGHGVRGPPFILSGALERPEPLPAFGWWSLVFVRPPVSALAV